jgi:agmatinase
MHRRSFRDLQETAHTTFFRVPTAHGDFSECDVVMLGVPFDGGAVFLPGSRFGPDHVRQCSRNADRPCLERDVRVRDGGNLAFPFMDRVKVRDVIANAVHVIATAGAVPFCVGGDHSITQACLEGLSRMHGPLALVHIDAHPDTSSSAHVGDRNHHGATVRVALEDGFVRKGAVFQIGVRVAQDLAFVKEWDLKVYPMDLLDSEGPAKVATVIRTCLGETPTYVSIDIDAVDPAFAPGTGGQEPGGLTSRELFSLVRNLLGIKLVGLDVVEILPLKDVSNITGVLGASVLSEGLALVLARDSRLLKCTAESR